MANFAAAIKEEIRRLARREVNAATSKTKQAVAAHRKEIIRLRKLVRAQQQKLAALESREGGVAATPPAEEDPLAGLRFSARSVRAQRRRLKLSAADYGKLLGVSGLTVYNWEHDKARPRKAQFVRLVNMRNISRREALKKLEEMAASPAE